MRNQQCEKSGSVIGAGSGQQCNDCTVVEEAILGPRTLVGHLVYHPHRNLHRFVVGESFVRPFQHAWSV